MILGVIGRWIIRVKRPLLQLCDDGARMMEKIKIIAEFICLVLMIANAYLAFKAKEKDDLIGMVWNLSFMIFMSTCIR
ncbi:hypothetical protein ACEVJK_13985 [Flintibacter sp. P01028]|uniref:hypothetical protein n=1 Tax=Flintibacter sp. P01028 TaxID=3342382 RepID=UPI0035B5C818